MIRQRGGRWRVVVQAGRDPFTRRRRQLSGSAPTEAAARRLEEDLLARVARMAAGDTELTLAQVVEEWWAAKPRLSPSAALNYRQNLDSHILPLLGERPVREIRPRLVAGFMRHLDEKNQLSPATIRKVRTVLSSVMSYAVAMEHTDANPVMKVPPPQLLDEGDEVAPTLEEACRILVAAEADQAFNTYLWLAAEAGGRCGEVLALRWRSIDVLAGVVHVSEAVSRGADGVHARPRTKTKQRREIALSTVTRRLLDAHQRSTEEKLSHAAGRPTTVVPDAFVFTTIKGARAGQPWRPDSTSRRFRRAKERAGVNPAITLHGLRRMMITELIGAGVDVKTVMGRAGHATERMTLSKYARVQPPKDAAAAELYGQLLDAELDRVRALADPASNGTTTPSGAGEEPAG